jgi:SAM-dependent methyltransferase
MTDTPKQPIALETRVSDADRLMSPSAARNRDIIADAFRAHMPTRGKLLEIASGTGEHAVHIARKLPELEWHPGDPDPASRNSIAAWTAHLGLINVRPPHAIDTTIDDWGVETLAPFDGVMSVNMIHIAPFEAAKGLIAGAGRLLRPGGKLFLYGPFSRNGEHTAPSNAEFDVNLKSRDPRWGVRDLENEIIPLATEAGLRFEQAISVPANNFVVLFERK